MKTELLRDEMRSWTRADYERFLQENGNAFPAWVEFYGALLEDSGYTTVEMARRCHVTRQTAGTWKKEIPAKRSQVIAIAMTFGMDAEHTDRLLYRYARYQKLDAKELSDAAALFLLEKADSMSIPPDDLYEAYLSLLEDCRKNGIAADTKGKRGRRKSSRETQKEWDPAAREGYIRTQLIREDLLSGSTREDFLAFVSGEEYQSQIRSGIEKFTAYLDWWLQGTTLETALQDQYDADAILDHVKALRKGRVYARRDMVIRIGMKLRMPPDVLNSFLQECGFEPLCPKDREECALLYSYQKLYEKCPDLFVDAPDIQEPELSEPLSSSEIFDRIWKDMDFLSDDRARRKMREAIRGELGIVGIVRTGLQDLDPEFDRNASREWQFQ